MARFGVWSSASTRLEEAVSRRGRPCIIISLFFFSFLASVVSALTGSPMLFSKHGYRFLGAWTILAVFHTCSSLFLLAVSHGVSKRTERTDRSFVFTVAVVPPLHSSRWCSETALYAFIGSLWKRCHCCRCCYGIQ